MRPFILGSFLVSVLFLSTAGLRADGGENLLRNPGFEDSPDVAASWSVFSPPESAGANCRVTISSDVFHSGKLAVLMQADEFARFGLGQGSFPVVSGDVYRVGVWVKAGADLQMQPESPGVTLRLNYPVGCAFIYLNDTISQPSPPSFSPLPVAALDLRQWTHVEAVVKVPAGVTTLRPEMFFWRAKGSLYVDAFNLQKVDPATPLSASAPNNGVTASAPPPGAGGAPVLTVKPDHLDGVYALNEPAVWTVDVTSGDRSSLTAVPYTVRRDGVTTIANGTIDLSAGPATITATRQEPGALLAVIIPPSAGNKSHSWTAGAIFAPEEIGPAVPAPADFDTFWKAKLQDLDAIPANPALAEGSVADIKYSGGVAYYKVTLDNIWNTHVQGLVTRPREGHKFPAMLIFQAAGVGPLDKGAAVSFAKRGFLVMNIEAHDMAIDQTPAFYNDLKANALKDYTSIGVGNRDTYYFLRMVLGCVRAAEYLTSRPDWDGKTLLVTGVSQGGFQSFATAALYPKVTALVSSAPAADDAYAALAKPPRPVAWPASLFPKRPNDPDGSIARTTLGYFDTIYFARRVHCPALVCVGLVDETVRPASVLAAYNAIPGKDKELMIFPFATHSLACSSASYWNREVAWATALQVGERVPPASIPAPTPLATLLSGPLAVSNAAPVPVRQ